MKKDELLDKPHIRISDLASLFGVHRSTITDWIEKGKLPPPTIKRLPGPRGGQAWLPDDFEKLMQKVEALETERAPSKPKSPAPRPKPENPVLTRSELLALFTSWLDGVDKPDMDFLAKETRRYLNKIAELHRASEEYRRLRWG